VLSLLCTGMFAFVTYNMFGYLVPHVFRLKWYYLLLIFLLFKIIYVIISIPRLLYLRGMYLINSYRKEGWLVCYPFIMYCGFKTSEIVPFAENSASWFDKLLPWLIILLITLYYWSAIYSGFLFMTLKKDIKKIWNYGKDD
jgi:hypothetical protein